MSPTVANRIGDTAVLKYRRTETLPLLGAMLLDLARLCRPCRRASSPHWRKIRAFPGTKAKSGERRTLRWREMDSNHRFPVAKEMNPVGEPQPSRRRRKSISKRYLIFRVPKRFPSTGESYDLAGATDIGSPHSYGAGSEIFAKQRDICFRRRWAVRQRLDQAGGGVECLAHASTITIGE